MEHKLTHIDEAGNAVMVDVGEKQITHRTALARGEIHMNEAAFAAVRDGTAKKGDVLGVAQIAGIMAAKKTADLIPLKFDQLQSDVHDAPRPESNRSLLFGCLRRQDWCGNGSADRLPYRTADNL